MNFRNLSLTVFALISSAAGDVTSEDYRIAGVPRDRAVISWPSDNLLQPDCEDLGGGLYAACDVPLATVAIDVIVLDRSNAASQDILFDGSGAPILNATDLDLGGEAGPRVSVIVYDEYGYDLRFTYFDVGDYSAAESRTATGAYYSFYGNPPLTPVDTYTVHYASELSSAELNGRWIAHPRVTLLAGARWLGLQETFDVFSSPGVGGFSDTDNDLFGFQVGGEAVLWTSEAMWVEASIKTGIYHNSAEVHAQSNDILAVPISLRASESHTSFAGEVNVGLVIPIWPGELRVGYQGLWIDGVALAPDQSSSLNFLAPGSIDYGTAMYHGGYFGWQVTF